MVVEGKILEQEGILEVLRLMAIAARTAPKGRGRDTLVTAAVFPGEDLQRLQSEMRRIAEETGSPAAFFARDAGNLDRTAAVFLVGSRSERLGLTPCGYCGFANCQANAAADGICAFNITDLSIAIASAAQVAGLHHVDHRVWFSVGKAAVNLKLLGEDVKIIYGIPLSVSSKNPFFDR
ncbi:MAG: ferredoxin domain-containing protein [Bacillota bacterium]|uniref:Uncharacterized protein, contains ferredoxin domain n=2 Tax=Carboxydocella TaxID=178898 RepID=A0A1T4S5T3_9FIRM|nr:MULTISPECIES: DUF2148 domain-containing protein [Carboxydocella]AVX21526.1 Uncharacterized protein, contains ferredoxin domain [Carboxydocella thermautotrophica]AVX32006.1 Uncharacterized protein, contains ferredoxin domain [Carboxydocella thermautotrophica]SKA23221.1 Uncharacterized protein, contains ferredoxin domain [Carboxydocella sporoproducens DSM 16521]GAW27760.1 ferredoxin domain containing protein [Carboxydocella sp. ULO1]GAW31667.1 ferredoxin domain containing protein [Carboxydoce